MRIRQIVPIFPVALGLLAGCDPGGSNRSPTPEQDPQRYARAVIEAAKVDQENQEAEAAFYRRLGASASEMPETEPPDHDSTEHDLEIAHNESGGTTP